MNKLTAFCEKWLNAWTGNKPEKLINFYTEDAYYSDPASKAGLRGHKELLPYFAQLLKYNHDWKWHVVEIMETAKGFTLKWEATIPVGTTVVTEQGLDIVELQGDKISRNEVFFDRTAWLKTIAENKWKKS